MTQPDRSAGAEFLDEDVVAAYVHRPDYPVALYDALLALMPGRARVLDLGTGPGKIARALASHVDEVVAVDPSPAMLKLGAALDYGAHPNIRWTQALAENLVLDDASLDLVVAGAAIHWMDPAQVLPRMARALAPGACMAIVEGDAPAASPWLASYDQVIQTWVARLGGVWNGPAHRAAVSAHLPWLDTQGEATFVAPIRQSLDDLVACQHSRATWSRARMGNQAECFDKDLRAALESWTSDGVLEFEIQTRLVWGRPRRTEAMSG